MSFEAVVGLEVHAQLATHSKLFCGCANEFGAPANSQTCPVCLGLPGALPVANGRAVDLAVQAALALGCRVHSVSGWARKSYFYPDLAKGYQITQYDRPLATGGALSIDAAGVERPLGIVRVHLEEDAGKTTHDSSSWVDFNRGGVPLIEIVCAPELESGAEAAAALKTLRQLLRYLGACEGNLERGNLRCDANVSIRPAQSRALGVRTELKNLNSFKLVKQAIDHEIERQRAVVASGGTVVQETRTWDPATRTSAVLRSKEVEPDYRYFPEPDLPDLVLTDADVERARAALPELPSARRARFRHLGVSEDHARVLTEDVAVADFFEAALARHNNPGAIANWVSNDILRERRATDELPVTPEQLAELVAMVDAEEISSSAARTVLGELTEHGGSPAAIVEARGLRQVSDEAALRVVIHEVIAAHPESAAAFRGGKDRALAHLVGQVMKASAGRANPVLVQQMLRAALPRDDE